MEVKLVILIFIGLVSLVNKLIKRSSELREKRKLEQKRLGIPDGDPFHSQPEKEPTPPASPWPEVNPSAEMRKLMEALGLPMEDEPPVIKRPPAPKPAPALPPLPAFEKPKRPLRPAAPPARVTAKQATAPSAAAAVTSRPPNPWATIVSSRQGTRQAIVLREILGPPKAFTL